MKLERIEKPVLPLVAVIGSVIAVASYVHTVHRDEKQDEQAVLKMTPKNPITLPNLQKKPEAPAPEVQKAVEQAPPPVDAPKQEPKPFSFWAYVARGANRHGIAAILFTVKSCDVERTSVTSSRYDRQLSIDIFNTTVTDSDGDRFRVGFNVVGYLQLDRDSPVPWKLEFPVNKDVVKPLAVRINGLVASEGTLENASFQIGQAGS